MPSPSVCNVLRSPPQLALDTIKGNVAGAWALRKVRSNATKCIRVRDDTGTETDIGFCGKNLCTSSLMGWLNRDLVTSQIGIDTNSDGVSDGWAALGTTNTTIASIDNSAQKIEITNSTNTLYNAYFQSDIIPCVAGNILTFELTTMRTGNTTCLIDISWYNGASKIGEPITTATFDSFTPKQLVVTAPVNTTHAIIIFGVKANNIGDTGAGWFKNASVTISNQSAYVKTIYDQSGNGNHATQTTASNQSRIVNVGIIDRDFDATKCALMYPTFASASSVNLVSNGDFSNGTTGWSGQLSDISASNNTITCTCDGTQPYGYIRQDDGAIQVGRKYFYRAKARVTNSVATSISIKVYNTDGTGVNTLVYAQNNPTQNEWYTLMGFIDIPSNYTGNLRFWVMQNYADASTANGKVMEVQEVVFTDVTDLGRPTMVFDGSNDCLKINDSASLNLTNAVTINAVNKTSTSVVTAGYLLTRNGMDSTELQYGLIWAITKRNDIYLNGAARDTSGDDTSQIGALEIATATYNSVKAECYINGVSDGSSDYSTPLTNRTNTFIGCRSNNAEGTTQAILFNGSISEVLLFNTALTTAQRLKLEREQGKYYGITVA